MEAMPKAHPAWVNVAVLGAGGTLAPAIVRELAESEEVANMLLLDLDGDRAEALAAERGAGRAMAQAIDAGEPFELARALTGSDVLVNAAAYRVNLDAMEACLAAGCHYIDLGGLYWMTLRQLELHPRFEAAGLTALLGMGSSPGKTNLMAALATAELGGTPAKIEVCAAGRDPSAKGRFSPPYALRTLLDELTLPPVVLRAGEPVELDPLAPGGEVDFGDPIGRADTIYTLHSELATFGESFGAQEVSFRLSLAPELLERLIGLVGEAEEQVARAGAEAVPPSSLTTSVHLVTASTEQRSVTVRALTRPHLGLGGSIVSTAAPAAAAVRLLARGKLCARGVLAPERAIDPAAMFSELEARGCSFSVTG